MGRRQGTGNFLEISVQSLLLVAQNISANQLLDDYIQGLKLTFDAIDHHL